MDEMVMRSVYLGPLEDSQLRQLAHELQVTKSDLIRTAIKAKLKQWLDAEDDQVVINEIEVGRRGGAARNSDSEDISAKVAAARGARKQLIERESATGRFNKGKTVQRNRPEVNRPKQV
jgi:Arc/MetJ-type ribon-helix-helix transcriptional regulator